MQRCDLISDLDLPTIGQGTTSYAEAALHCGQKAVLVENPQLAHCCQCQHNADVPKSITIRDVPDETTAELAARAAATGRSLQEYLRGRLVDLAAQPDAEVMLVRLRERKRATGGTLSADVIVDHRDAGRR